MGSVARMTKPYRAAMMGKWQEVMGFYDKHSELVHTPLTATGDTALHVAVHSLHAAAAAGNLEAAKLLLRYDEKLLPLQDNREETALFRAAAYGRTRVVKFLASKVQDMGPHVRRKDSTSILHIAILGKHFETAVELLKLGVSPDMVDENGMTGFQLLANMSSAFKSGYPMGKLKALLYYCLPEVDYADNDKEEIDSGPQLILGEDEDLETGHLKKRPQIYSSSRLPICSGGDPGKISTSRDDKEEGDEGEKKEDKGDDDGPQAAAADQTSFLLRLR
ncbi:hypothetical protein FNV43_RR06578 [Rhamnella rubrinervis]|uniref:Uncharacterized protein n=1 Tax=Rhamnella rubrinervis TaxID=2594499 RepID=A0A8K0HET9_9ROSA|nr:hypothetical protein FNV43_RR06578 [Rhamnella rubrinervis]